MKLKPRFGLKAVFVLITLFAALFSWILWNWQVVEERRTMAMEIRESWKSLNLPWQEQVKWVVADKYPDEIPLIRKLLGDQYYGTMYVPAETPNEVVERAKDVFQVMTYDNFEAAVEKSFRKP